MQTPRLQNRKHLKLDKFKYLFSALVQSSGHLLWEVKEENGYSVEKTVILSLFAKRLGGGQHVPV